MAGWLEFYALSDDPFSVSPLLDQSQEPMFHRTGDIERQVTPFLNVMATAHPRVRLIVSERGMGKTSLLRYIERSFQTTNATTFYVAAMESLGKGKTHIDLARGVLRDLLSKMLKELVVQHPDVYTKYASVIDYKLSLLGMSIIDSQVWTTGDSAVELGDISKHLTEVAGIYKTANIRFAVFLDNLDKYDAPDTLEVVYQLLKMPVSQSAFEILMEGGATIFLAVATPLYRRMVDEPRGDFSYLDDPFVLNPLRPGEAHALLATRFRAHSAESLPLEAEAVVELVADTGGNIRRLFKRAKRVLEYGADHKTRNISRLSAVRAMREAQDFPSILRELGNEPTLLNGMQFVARTLANEVDPARTRSFLKSSVRAHQGRRLSTRDRSILEQFAIGDLPIKIQDNSFMINDQALLDFINFLANEGVDAEGFIDWLLDRKTVPEFFLSDEGIECRMVGTIIDRLSTVPVEPGQVKIGGRKEVVHGPNQAREEVLLSLKRFHSDLRLWDGGGIAELPPPDQVLRITQGLASFYKGLAIYWSAKLGTRIDLSSGVIFGYVQAIELSLPNTEQAILPVDRIKRLGSLHTRISIDGYNPSKAEVEEVKQSSLVIVRSLARNWMRNLGVREGDTKALIDGEAKVAQEIASALDMSETGLGLVHLPGKTLRDFSLYFWRGEFSYWGFRNAGANSKHIAESIVKDTIHNEGVAKQVHLGSAALDTNVLVSGVVNKAAPLGLWKHADLIVLWPIFFEYTNNQSKSLRDSVLRDISRIERLRGREIKSFRIVRDSPGTPLNGIPGADKELNNKIDELFSREAEEDNLFLVTTDRDQLGHSTSRAKTLYLPPGGELKVFPIDSIRELLASILTSDAGPEIRIYNQYNSDAAIYKVNKTEDGVSAVYSIPS